MGDLLRSLNRKNYNQHKKSVDERQRSPAGERIHLAKPFGSVEKRQKREGPQNEQKPKYVTFPAQHLHVAKFLRKTHPQVILDTDLNEVRTLTREVADSLTPPNAPNESSNIEQELLDVLRGHRVVSKNTRHTEKPSEAHSEPTSFNRNDRPATGRRARAPPKADIEQTTEAFS